MTNVIFVTYDSVENSVFNGQVLQPLLERKKRSPFERICLITFERKKISDVIHAQLITALGADNIIILPRLPFLGRLSLWHSVWHLKKALSLFSNYQIIARGPLAGWIALKARSHNQLLVIQARGLLGHEYDYAHMHSNIVTRYLHAYRAHQLHSCERDVYSCKDNNVTFQAVSPALRDYLVKEFNTSIPQCTVADHDIPAVIPTEQRNTWRVEMRKKLNIPLSDHVYCYNGSAKAWQCPEMTIYYFKERLLHKPESFLLIITQDIEPFKRLLSEHCIPTDRYHIQTVRHNDVYAFLSACDTGIIFRKPHVINWISRPTKVLEYKSVNLDIMHNNTIAWLCEK